jgi:metallo-beta-lactamase family protein
VRSIQGLSAHAGRSDLLQWLSHFRQPPRRLIVTHGEEKAALALAEEIRTRMGWEVTVPQYMDEISLS